MKRIVISLSPLLSVTLLLLFSCKETTTVSEANHKLRIVTTTGHIADLVRHVTGDKAEVHALMGPGVDPHLYKASLSDLKDLSSADIIFYNGLHLEGKMGEVFHKLSRTKKVFAVSDGIPKEELLLADPANHIPDPHIWFDVVLWRHCLRQVKEVMMQTDTVNALHYKNQAWAYDKQLEYLNEQVYESIQQIPSRQRLLVTAHDAFGYFGRRYKMEVLGLQGISTLSEYGLNEITRLTRLLTERNVKAVFVETSVSEKAIQSVIEGCKQKGHEVVIGGSLYSDALGATNSAEGTYIGMFHANVKTIHDALLK